MAQVEIPEAEVNQADAQDQEVTQRKRVINVKESEVDLSQRMNFKLKFKDSKKPCRDRLKRQEDKLKRHKERIAQFSVLELI